MADNVGKAARRSGIYRLAGAAPFGIIAGACAIVVFFATVGLIVAHLVLNGIASATESTSSFFENWWQVLLFIADVLFFLGLALSLTMFVIRVTANRRDAETTEDGRSEDEK